MSQNPPVSTPCVNVKPTNKLFCGIDIAAKTFTVATCKLDDQEKPLKATNYKQTPQDFEALQNHLLQNQLPPNDVAPLLWIIQS